MKAILLIFVACVAVALTGFQHYEGNRLRAENEALTPEAAEAETIRKELTAPNASAGQDVEAEIGQLRLANRDLPRLRNEIGQLRQQIPQSGRAPGHATTPAVHP